MHQTETRELNRMFLENSNIPERFFTLDVEKYKGDATAMLTVARYTKHLKTMREDGIGLLFRGPTESYKTFLACYVAMFAMVHKHSARYYAVSEMVDAMLNNEMKPRDLKEPDFFVLDNLNSETNNFWQTALSRFLTYRKDAGKPVILCTRLDDHAFTATYGKENLALVKALCEEVVTHADSGEIERRRAKQRNVLYEEAE